MTTVSAHAKQIGSGFRITGNPQDGAVLLEGFAVRCTPRRGSGRHVTDFILPGDFVLMDTSLNAGYAYVETLAPSQIVKLSKRSLKALEGHANIQSALRSTEVIREATLRAWLINLGRGSAEEKLAHVFCELHHRMHEVSRVRDNQLYLPMTQFDLADALGLSYVHVNRMLKMLRERRLAKLRSKVLSISDLAGLHEFCHFNPHYLLGQVES